MTQPVSVNYAKPFIKWLGGKSQLLSEIEEHKPIEFESYFEPFLGSGAVFFKLIPDTKNAIINDINTRLIGTYTALRDNLGEVLDHLHEFESEFNKGANNEIRSSYFYGKRKQFNDLGSSLTLSENTVRAALFIFLNKTCFNGVYRENSQGHFNVPFGQRKRYAIFDIDNLIAVSNHLHSSKIYSCNYSKVLGYAREGDFIYLDPPYYPLTKTSSFTKYHAKDFLKKQQIELKSIYDKLDTRGCFVMMSNSDTEFIDSLYKDYNVLKVRASRTINCKSDSRGKICESLIKNY